MTRLVGQVVSGIGDLSQWMRRYREAYRAAAGVELVPGSLNVQLASEFRLPEQHRIHLGPEEAGVGVSLVPCYIDEQPAFLFRTDRNEAGIGDHPRNIIEIVADVHLREELGLQDGDHVEIIVPRTN